MKKPIKKYEPELGQIAFGNPTGEYELPEYASALLFYLFEEIERIYWNKNQEEWEDYEDPKFKGIEVRPYYWGENKKEKIKPNFKYKNLKIRWYKHPMRGASCNQWLTVEQWVGWFNDCLYTIRKNEPKLYQNL